MLKILFKFCMLSIILFAKEDYSIYENKLLLQHVNNRCIFIDNNARNRSYLILNNCKQEPLLTEDHTVVIFTTEHYKFNFSKIPLEKLNYNGNKYNNNKILQQYIQWEKDYVENLIGTKITLNVFVKNGIIYSYYVIPKSLNKYIHLDDKRYIHIVVAKYIKDYIFSLGINTDMQHKNSIMSFFAHTLNSVVIYSRGEEIGNIIKKFNKK